MISIIVPVYKVEQYLPQCIDSILSQTFTDFELLLINDGSPDTSGEICDTYAQKDSRIRVFHKKNGGVSSARNLGIKEAKGEWINFIDSDDWIPSDYFEGLMSDKNIADLTFWGFTLYLPNGSQTQYIPAETYVEKRNDIEQCLANLKINPQKFEYLGYTVNKLFKTSIIKTHNIKFIEHLSFREDEVFTLSYAQHINSIRVKSAPSYNYRIISSSLTHRNIPKEEYLLLIKELTHSIKNYNNKDLLSKENNAILYYQLEALKRYKLRTPIWLTILNNFIKKGNFQKKQNGITDKKIKLIFSYNCRLLQYITAIIFILGSKFANKFSKN